VETPFLTSLYVSVALLAALVFGIAGAAIALSSGQAMEAATRLFEGAGVILMVLTVNVIGRVTGQSDAPFLREFVRERVRGAHAPTSDG
jgi:hypothetical protein